MIETADLNTSVLNQLSSEIIILDQNLKSLWINESALSNGWANSQNEFIKNQYPEELNSALFNLLKKSQDESSSFSKRDMELINRVNEKRIIDLTVSLLSIRFFNQKEKPSSHDDELDIAAVFVSIISFGKSMG